MKKRELQGLAAITIIVSFTLGLLFGSVVIFKSSNDTLLSALNHLPAQSAAQPDPAPSPSPNPTPEPKKMILLGGKVTITDESIYHRCSGRIEDAKYYDGKYKYLIRLTKCPKRKYPKINVTADINDFIVD